MQYACSFPKWSNIRGFGNIKYFNISYGLLFAIPILYEIHEKISPAVGKFVNFSPFSTSLKLLYVSSVCYAIAIAIYQFRCPKEIKRFGEPDEYISSHYDIFYRSHPHHRLSIILARLDPDIDREVLDKIKEIRRKIRESYASEKANAETELSDLLASLHPDAVQRYLEQDYKQKDELLPIYRWTSFLLYVVGTLIVLGLLIDRSYRVLFET